MTPPCRGGGWYQTPATIHRREGLLLRPFRPPPPSGAPLPDGEVQPAPRAGGGGRGGGGGGAGDPPRGDRRGDPARPRSRVPAAGGGGGARPRVDAADRLSVVAGDGGALAP